MIRTLIADDEDIIRHGIAGFLKRDPEIEVVGEAEDGEIALEQAQRLLPDLLLVDINMPFVNGLEFIEQLTKIQKNCVVIVITGYDNFDYAQRALKLGVFDYLLKPVMEDAFYPAIDRAKRHLAMLNQKSRYIGWARAQVKKNYTLLLSQFLNEWIVGSYASVEVEERIRFLELKLPEQYGLCLMRLSLDERRTQPGEEWNEDLLMYAAENIAAEVLGEPSPVFCRDAAGRLLVIAAAPQPEAFRPAVNGLCGLLEKNLPVQVLFATAAGTGWRTIPDAYLTVCEEMDGKNEYSQLVSQARQCMEQGYATAGFSLQETADRLHVSPQYLSRIFRQETGVTFIDYLTRLRIRRALGLLADENVKIYEIAERLGYANQHYFSNAFKKVLGVSPAEYRKNLKA